MENASSLERLGSTFFAVGIVTMVAAALGGIAAIWVKDDPRRIDSIERSSAAFVGAGLVATAVGMPLLLGIALKGEDSNRGVVSGTVALVVGGLLAVVGGGSGLISAGLLRGNFRMRDSLVWTSAVFWGAGFVATVVGGTLLVVDHKRRHKPPARVSLLMLPPAGLVLKGSW